MLTSCNVLATIPIPIGHQTTNEISDLSRDSNYLGHIRKFQNSFSL